MSTQMMVLDTSNVASRATRSGTQHIGLNPPFGVSRPQAPDVPMGTPFIVLTSATPPQLGAPPKDQVAKGFSNDVNGAT